MAGINDIASLTIDAQGPTSGALASDIIEITLSTGGGALPIGGNSGDLIIKNSSIDNDASWKTILDLGGA